MKSWRRLAISLLMGAGLLAVQTGPSLAAQAAADPADPPGARGVGGRQTPTFKGPPAGMTALPVDLWKSKNYYQQQKDWTDQRYYRCNTPRQMSDMWTNNRIAFGDGSPPESAAWGDCKMDVPREQIVSHLPYKTAEEHYRALQADAKKRGGPTHYTKATMPDWDGWYQRQWNGQGERPTDPKYDSSGEWLWGTFVQMPTILSLLTPEYQRRQVQLAYHESVNNAPQWDASFCMPEGYLRMWAQLTLGGTPFWEVSMNQYQVQFLASNAKNFLRRVLIDREPVQKVPQWYGETVGFWDGDTLVTWTSHVQGWEMSHGLLEWSGRMEAVEVFKPEKNDKGEVVAFHQDTTFYDDEAFVQPMHAGVRYLKIDPLNSPTRRFTYTECLTNLRNVNGRPQQTTNTDPRFIDYYGRPWAQNWEKWFEQGWEKPERSNVPNDVLDLLK